MGQGSSSQKDAANNAAPAAAKQSKKQQKKAKAAEKKSGDVLPDNAIKETKSEVNVVPSASTQPTVEKPTGNEGEVEELFLLKHVSFYLTQQKVSQQLYFRILNANIQ